MFDISNSGAAQILLRTKLNKPVISKDLIARPRLYVTLDMGLQRPFTLISAPAGYGKTTLVSSWLQSVSRPSLWVSLDENDNDLRLFLRYFINAIQLQHPTALRRTEMMLAGPNLPEMKAIGDTLIGELQAIEDEFILVLDDLHLIHDHQIYDLLRSLLRFPPQCLHLIIITRQDPPLALSKLRASGLMVEIRGQELRFSRDETAAFISQATGEPLTKQTLDILENRTEGWAAGLRLTALTLRYGVEVSANDGDSHALNRYVIDYLMDEVLERVPPEIEMFLIKTSVLDAMCGALCDAVVQPAGGGQGQSHLEWLEANNLFIVALDEQGHWFRYHHLFREFLIHRMQQKLSPEEISTLHINASNWLSQRQLLEEALRHALAAHDIHLAVLLIAGHRHHLLNTEQRPVLEHWLQLLPPGTVNAHPELLLAEAWIAELGRSNSRTVLELIDRAQTLIDEQSADDETRFAQLQGELDTLRSLEKTFAAEDPQSVIALTSHALQVMPKDWYLARSEAWLHLTLAWQMAGDLTKAYDISAMACEEDETHSSRPRVRNAGGLAFVQWIAGDLTGLLQTARETQRSSEISGQHETLGWEHYFAASARYQRNELESAERHALRVMELRYACHPITVVQCATILALVHQARGQTDEAQATVERAFDFLRETGSDALIPILRAFSAELAAMRGDFDSAIQWSATLGPMIPLRIMAFSYAPQLTAARVLVHTGNPSDLPLAAENIQRIEKFVTSTHNTWFTIEVLALRALERAAADDMPAALQALERAVALAQSRSFIRVFADMGSPMAHLLEKLAQQGIALSYIRRSLLPAINHDAYRSTPQAVIPQDQAFLAEPLTAREMEVLELLAGRLSAKEIANRLFISDRTVKRHAANIYQKLGVHSRNEAIEVARMQDILLRG